MRLRYSKTSPFVRKVLVAAHELGIADRIENVPTDPWSAETDLGHANPLLKVPALEFHDGSVLIESARIAEYLDGLAEPALYPADPVERRHVEQRVALIDGATDAAVLRGVEGRMRPEEHRWAGWDARQKTKVDATLDILEAGPLSPPNRDADIVSIALACFLAYLDFRFADEDWRAAHPNLAGWYSDFGMRPSMEATRPDA